MDLSAITAEAKAVVDEATGIADLADKWADRVRPLVADIPSIGTEADAAIAVLDNLDKALHEAKTILDAI